MVTPGRCLAVVAALAMTSACGDDTASGEADGEAGTSDIGIDTDTPEDTSAAETGDACEGASLECPGPVQAECTGIRTSVELDPPSACGGEPVESNAPADYPVGTTEVTFEADSGSQRCSTSVTISDGTAPELACPTPGVVLRTEAGVGIAPPAASATDVCDAMPVVSASPSVLEDSGAVIYEARDAAGNVVMCQADFELVDAFAVEGFRVLSARLDANETRVTLGWEPPTTTAVDEVRIESAPDVDGPWSEVATVSASVQIYDHVLSAPTQFLRVVSSTEHGDGGATSARQVFRIATDGYDVRDVDVPNVPFDTTLYGVVRHPISTERGPFPLVVALHGNHGNCRDEPNDPFDYCVTTQDHECADPSGVTTPNAEGYIYFLETLAAQGIVAVSVSGNAMNCRDDFIFERAELIGEHLRSWSAWNETDMGETQNSFVGRLDLDRVGLVGHSRGGDAAANVPGILAGDPIPGVNVRSIFAVAPTDFHAVEVPSSDYAVLLPGCDLDVAPLSGMNHYDRSIELDDGARRAQVFVLGMNHNFFNTQWRISEWDLFGQSNDPFCTPDDDDLMLAQTRTLEALLGSWFRETLQSSAAPEPFMQARAPSPSSLDAWSQTTLEMRWSYSGGPQVMVDDFSAAGAPVQNTLGGVNTFDDWFLFERCFEQGCDPFFNHVKPVLRLLWQLPAEPMATFGLQGYDASGHDALAMRVVSRRSLLNQGLQENDFFVRVRDGSGAVAEVPLSAAKPLRHLYPHSDPLEVLETFHLPLALFEAAEPALDFADLEALEFDMTATGADGSVIVSDIAFLGE